MARERRVIVPYGFETVTNAVSLLLERSGWEVVKADKEVGHFEVSLRFDPLRFPETFFIEVSRLDDSRTEVFMGGTIRYVILDLGMTGAYMDSFFNKLLLTLKENQA